MGRYDLVNAVSRIRQSSRDPEVVLNRFLLLVAGSPTPGKVEQPWGDQIREVIVPAELAADPEIWRGILYLLMGVLIGGMLFLGVLVLSLSMGQC